MNDHVKNTRWHRTNYDVRGTVVSIPKPGLVEVRYDSVSHIPGTPEDKDMWPVGTHGTSQYFLWEKDNR